MLYLVFPGNFVLFSTVAEPIYFPANSVQGCLFSISTPTLAICGLFVDSCDKFDRCEGALFVDLICISLMTSDAEPLLMYLLDICMSSLEECPLRSLAHLKMRFFSFWLLSYVKVKGKVKVIQSCLTLCDHMD